MKVTKRSIKYSSTMIQALNMLEEGAAKDVLRPAVYEGITILYNMLKMNTPVGPTGNMKDSVYRYHDDGKSGDTRQTYATGVNMKKAPHWHLVEYGHKMPYLVYRVGPDEWRTKKFIPVDPPGHTPAYPFLRPTFLHGTPLAVAAMRDELAARIKYVIRNTKVMP